MRRSAVLVLALGVWSALMFLAAPPASAVPSFSRRYGIPCSSCHTVWGALNANGVTFKLSGYRRMNGRDMQPTVKDIDVAMGALHIPAIPPLSIVGSTGFDYVSNDRRSADGVTSSRTGSSLDLEDISIFIASPLGDHVSTFIEFPMFETRSIEFSPTGPAEAEDIFSHRNIQFETESPTFEVAKVFWNSLLPTSVAPVDSLNALFGITHLPLAYSPGKVRLSVTQYLVYERRPLELISPVKLENMLSSAEQDRLFKFGEPQVLAELNGYMVPFGQITDLGKKETFWIEYHGGISNGSNDQADPNTQKDIYGRFVMRWYGQGLGVFGLYSPDVYDDDIRDDASIAKGGIMSGRQHANATTRVGPDLSLSLVPFGIPVWLDNQLLYGHDSDITGFGKSFTWWGGFSQLNWKVFKPLIAYGRYDWIHGDHYDDTTVGGVTDTKPREWAGVFGLQYLVLENLKLTAEYRRREFENTASAPRHEQLKENFFTLRASLGF